MTDASAPEPIVPPPAQTARPAPPTQTAPPTPPTRRSRRRLGLAAAAVAVVLVAGGGTAFALTSGDGPDPEEAVRAYDQVFKDVDCAGFTDVTTQSFRAELGLTTCAKFDNNAKDASIASFRLAVESSDVSGDKASVRTRETFSTATGEQTINLVYSLVKEDGDWKVSKIAQNKST